MRVLILCSKYGPDPTTGMATHVAQLAAGLPNKGYKVDIFGYEYVSNIDNSTEKTLIKKDDSTAHLFCPLRGTPQLTISEELASLNRELVHDALAYLGSLGERPALIHCHDCRLLLAAKELQAAFSIPLVSTVHLLIDDSADLQILQMQREMCVQSTVTVAVSRFVKEWIKKSYGVAPEQIRVVYNGVDLAQFQDAQFSHEDLIAARRVFTSDEQKLIMYAGRLSPQKGISALLRSTPAVIRQYKNVAYIIAGDYEGNTYAPLLIMFANNHPQLKGKIRFIGRQSRQKLAMIYQLADIAVVPSLCETFGYAAAEAMAAGVPVIATEVGGLPEVLDHGKCGLLVPLLKQESAEDVNIDMLSSAQLELLTNSEYARKLGLAGRKKVESEFGLPRMIDAVSVIYAEVCGQQGSSVQAEQSMPVHF